MSTLTTVLTPWYRRSAEAAGGGGEVSGSSEPTKILDYLSTEVALLLDRARATASSSSALDVLAAAHSIIRDEVRAVYSLDESTSASRTLRRGSGSCSQRLAVVESVARAGGVRTRVRALLIDRSFWNPRFPRIGFLLPDRMLLVWPEFEIDGVWRSASDLFGSIGCRGGGAFTNSGSETLFEAVGRCAVDWDGRSQGSEFDLSHFVRVDHGYFPDRDAAFARLGQTLAPAFLALVEPVLRRVSA
jgi:hypothetical protein